LKWLDEENNQKTLDCYFPQKSENYGKSKGLYEIAKELGVVQNNKKVSLPNLRDLLREHPAFKTKTKLFKVFFCCSKRKIFVKLKRGDVMLCLKSKQHYANFNRNQ
jgi:hypothetical protein